MKRKIYTKTVAILLLAFLFYNAKAQNIIYVDVTHTATPQTGASWATAFSTMDAAITMAVAGNQIWVAKGTYKEASSGGNLAMKAGVKVYGGFYDTATLYKGNDTAYILANSRNFVTNLTTLKGYGSGNSLPVVSFSATAAASTVLDGFTVTGGLAGSSSTSGGGVSIISGSPTLANLIVTGNTAGSGGGIYMSSSSASLTNVTVSGNTVSNTIGTNPANGGGIYISSSSPTLTNVTVSSNTVSTTVATNTVSGGGIYINNASPLLNNVTVSGNVASGGTLSTAAISGGGIYMTGSSPLLTNVTISGNTVSCVLTTNTTVNGGGIYMTGSSPQLSTVTLSGNTAVNGGGGIYAGVSGSPLLNSVTFLNNKVTASGSPAAADQQDGGGGMFINGTVTATLNKVLFQGNTAVSSQGGGLMIASYASNTASAIINKSIFYSNTAAFSGGMYAFGVNTLNITNSVFAYDSTTSSTSNAYAAGGIGTNTITNYSILSSTFYNNYCNTGGATGNAANIDLRYLHATASNTVTNCVFYHTAPISTSTTNNNGSIGVNSGTNPTITYSYLPASANSSTTNNTMPSPSATNDISTANPFSNTSAMSLSGLRGSDGIWMTPDDGLELNASSLPHDDGSNAAVSAVPTDIVDSTRQIGVVDMGAYELGISITNQPDSQIICPGTTANISFYATAVTEVNYTLSYQWLKNGVAIPGATSNTYTITGATINDTASYRMVAISTPSVPANAANPVLYDTSNIATLSSYRKMSVSPASQGPICSGSTPSTNLVATSNNSNYTNTSSVAKWEYSYSKFGSPVDSVNIASSASNTLSTASMKPTTTGGITGTIYYRALVQNPGCAASYSDTVVVLVNGSSTLSASQNICQGSSPSSITASNIVGTGTNTFTWQYSTNPGFTSPIDISLATANPLTSAQIGSFTGTRYYRAKIKNGSCVTGGYSTIDSIVVSPPTQAGSVSAGQVICSGTAPGSITLTGNVGTVLYWQSSTDNFSTFSTVSASYGLTTLTSAQTGNLTASTQYRPYVQSGACTGQFAGIVQITVNTSVGGTASNNQSICTNGTPQDLSVSGINGTVLYWQSSTDSFKTVVNITTIPSSGSSTLIGNRQMGAPLTASTYYRAAVQIGSCTIAYSNIVTVAVSGNTVGGTTASAQTICYNTSPANITLSGNTGTVLRWQYSIDSFAIDSHDTATGAGTILTSSQMGTLTANRYYRAVVQNGACSSANSSIVLIKVNNTNVWTGATSKDWNTASNWACNFVPLITTDVYIPGGLTNYPIVGILPAGLSHSITIDSLASVTLINNDTLKIADTIMYKGLINALEGSVELQGTTPQTIDGKMFVGHTINNLIINNPTTVNVASTANDTLSIVAVLSFDNINNATFNTGGNIELLSTATLTARVADITNNGVNSGNQIKGKVIVDRYIPEQRSWRFLTAPVTSSNTIHQAWQNNGVYVPNRGTLITMPSPKNGMDTAINSNYSCATFNPATQAFVNLNNALVPISAGSSGSADNSTYMIFVRGDRTLATIANPNFGTPPMENTVLSSYGNLQTYNQVFTAVSDSGKFTAVGNPYASPIDFNNLQLTNVNKRFYILDPNLNQVGGYVVLDDVNNTGTFTVVPASAQTHILQSGQAFFVQTHSKGAASVTINERSKTSGDNVLVFRPAPPASMQNLNMALNVMNADSSVTAIDGALTQFDNIYSPTVDFRDASKLSNINEGIGFVKGVKTLSINRRPAINSNDTLYIKLTATTAKNYQLELDANDLNRPGLTGRLIDNYLDSSTNLNLNATNRFNFSVTADAASAVSNRFMIVFKQDTLLPVTFINLAAKRQTTAVLVNWKVANEENVNHYEVERSTDGINFSKVATVISNDSSNYQWVDSMFTSNTVFYLIKSIDNAGAEVYSDTVKVNPVNTTPSITILDNLYDANGAAFKFNYMAKGTYTANLLGVNGQRIGARTIVYAGGTSDVVVNFGQALAKGIYIVEIVCTDNTIKSFKIITR